MCYELTMCTTHFFGLTWLCYAFFGENFHFSGLLKAQLVFVFFYICAIIYRSGYFGSDDDAPHDS